MNFFSRSSTTPKAEALKVGDALDSFPAYKHKLSSDSGASIALSDYKGKKAVAVFFYPKDETPGVRQLRELETSRIFSTPAWATTGWRRL
jgi:peroxiredoxin